MKRFLPDRLFSRFLAIVIIPILLLIIASSIVFMERNSREMQRFAAKNILHDVNHAHGDYKGITTPENYIDAGYELMEQIIGRKIISFDNKFALYGGKISILIPEHKIPTNRTYLFIGWTIICAIIIAITAIIFIKNQVRAIINLRDLAINIDRGKVDNKIQPSGAQEVREATIAFIEMQERIKQQIAKKKL